MNIREYFRQTANLRDEYDIHALSNHSIVEARDKEKRLLAFYNDPYQDGSENWWLAKKTYEYLRFFKTEGQKRKNKYQEDILHEQNICFLLKGMHQAGLLPKLITYQIVDKQVYPLPCAHQSIERAFCLAHIHDTDEDFPGSSAEGLEKFLSHAITHADDLTPNQKIYYIDMADTLSRSLENITFGRKCYDAEGNVVKEATHENDPQIYFDALESSWETILVKACDRERGIVDRYGPIPYVFTLKQQKKYMAETEDLFYFRQPLENMQKRYPELADAFKVLNARMNVAYRSMRMIVSFHPDNEETHRKTGNPANARLHLTDFLPQAMSVQQHIDDDADDMKDLLFNLEFVSARRPILRPITNQLRDQLQEYLPELHNTPPVRAILMQPEMP